MEQMVVAPQLGRLAGCLLTVQPAKQAARRAEHYPEEPETDRFPRRLYPSPPMMLRSDGLLVKVKIFVGMQVAPCVKSCAEEGGNIRGTAGTCCTFNSLLYWPFGPVPLRGR